MTKRIKSLVLSNLDDIFASKVKDLIVFISQNSINNTKDITNILIYYVFCELLKIYKSQSGMILFYMSTKCYNWLQSDGGVVREMDFKKVVDLFTKKIKFPIVITSLSYDDFQSMLASNSPTYDELVNEYKFISEFWDEILKVIKNLRFYSLEDNLQKNFLEHLEYITTFKNHE